MFVGDNPEADIMGAKNAGMKTIWKQNSHWEAPTGTAAIVDELNEIPDILQQFKSS